jgi:hypothetical protein
MTSGSAEVSTIFFDPASFEVVFQVTKEASNLRDVQLTEVGLTFEDTQELLGVLRMMRDQKEDGAGVRIDLNRGDVTDSARDLSIRVQDAISVQDTEPDIHARLSVILAARWHTLLEKIIAVLGERELYLRTGFDVKTIRDKITVLYGI